MTFDHFDSFQAGSRKQAVRVDPDIDLSEEREVRLSSKNYDSQSTNSTLHTGYTSIEIGVHLALRTLRHTS